MMDLREFEDKCRKCNVDLESGDRMTMLCKSCRVDKSNEAYLDYGAFAQIREETDRNGRPPTSYDNYWETDLWLEGVYE